ncbi:MAG: carbohydrate binding domain-containing protein [Thermoplasmatota archaeon]
MALAAGSAMPRANIAGSAYSLDLYLTAAQRRQLAGLCEARGSMVERRAPFKVAEWLDASPRGEGTIAFIPDPVNNAATLREAAWLVVDSWADDPDSSATLAKAQLTLRELATGPNADYFGELFSQFYKGSGWVAAIGGETSLFALPVGVSQLTQPGSLALGTVVKRVPVGANLVVNPDFETDASSWTLAGGTGSVARNAGDSKRGSACLQVIDTDAGNVTYAYQRVAVTPGVTYVLAAWVKQVTNATARSTIMLAWLDAGNNVLGSTQSSTVVGTNGRWQHVGLTGVAPAKATQVEIRLTPSTTAADQYTSNFDAVQLRPSVPLLQSPFTEPTIGNYAGVAVKGRPIIAAWNLGDVAVYDASADATDTDATSSYTRYFGTRGTLSDPKRIILDNGLVRLVIDEAFTTGAKAYVQGDVALNLAGQLVASHNSTRCPFMRLVSVVTNAPSLVELIVQWCDTQNFASGDNLINGKISLRRGVPGIEISGASMNDATNGTFQFEPPSGQWRAFLGDNLVGDANLAASTDDTTLGSNYVTAANADDPQFIVTASVTEKPDTAPTAARVSSTDGIGFRVYAPTLFAANTWGFYFHPWTWGFTHREAENGTLVGTAATEADAGSSNGQRVKLLANGDQVTFTAWSQSELPIGDYYLVVRAKDTNQVANDFRFRVNDVTAASDIATSTLTLAAAYAYKVLAFSLTVTAHQLSLIAEKITAGANTIYVDDFWIIPKAVNSTSPDRAVACFPDAWGRGTKMPTRLRDVIRRAT